MATKLKGLEVGKVDFVDEGANQRADIKLLKGKNKAEETSDPEIGLFKRFLNWISGEVQKSATTFDEQINAVSMDAIRDEIWSVCYALQNSLNSILCLLRRLMAQYWQQAQFLQFLQQIRWKLLSSRLCELLRSQRMKPWILRLKRSFLEYLGMFRQIRLQLWHHRSMALQRLPTARKLRAVPKKKTMKIITKESMLNSKIRSSMSRMMLTILSGPKKFPGLEIVL